MELLFWGALLALGGVYSLFDGSGGDTSQGDSTDPQHPDPSDPDHVHGTMGADTLAADHGLLSGWGGDDHLSLTGTATGYGNQGQDTIDAHDDSTAYGGLGDDSLTGLDSSQSHGGDGHDFLDINASASGWGDGGDDTLNASEFGYTSGPHATIHGGDGNDVMTASAGQAFGDSGNDVMSGGGSVILGLDPHLFGGDGRDFISAGENTFAQGDAGNDVIALSFGAHGDGGAGDDRMILSGASSHFLGTDTGPVVATGGAGHDSFAINLVEPTAYSTDDAMVITDFDPTQDHLMVESTGGQNASHIFDHASSVENTAQGYTDVTLHWHPADATQTMLTNTLRLQDVTGFDLNSIQIVSSVDGTGQAPIGNVLNSVTGTAGPDHLVGQTNAFLNTGAGDDVITTAATGQVVADLGAGDDSFTATGAAHIVYGGTGDDSYVMNAPSGAHTLPDHQGGLLGNVVFDGGAGNDSILIRDDGTASNLTAADHATFLGGDGIDHIEARAGTGILTMKGGAGDDVLVGRAGQYFNTGEAGDLGTDDLTLNLTATELAANGAAHIKLLGQDHLTINVDPGLTGPISFHYNTAGNGVEVNSTEIRIGGVTVAVVDEGIPLIEDAIALGDSQLTVNRL